MNDISLNEIVEQTTGYKVICAMPLEDGAGILCMDNNMILLVRQAEDQIIIMMIAENMELLNNAINILVHMKDHMADGMSSISKKHLH